MKKITWFCRARSCNLAHERQAALLKQYSLLSRNALSDSYTVIYRSDLRKKAAGKRDTRYNVLVLYLTPYTLALMPPSWFSAFCKGLNFAEPEVTREMYHAVDVFKFCALFYVCSSKTGQFFNYLFLWLRPVMTSNDLCDVEERFCSLFWKPLGAIFTSELPSNGQAKFVDLGLERCSYV